MKQYETELAELKARNEALVYDNNRKSDDNAVSNSLTSPSPRFDSPTSSEPPRLEQRPGEASGRTETSTGIRDAPAHRSRKQKQDAPRRAAVQPASARHGTVEKPKVPPTHARFVQAIDEIRRQKRVEVRSFDDNLRQQYDDRLLHELQQLRTQTEDEMQSLRDDIAAQYEKKIESLENTIRRNADQAGSYRTDVVSYRERIDEMTKSRDALNDKVAYLEQRCRDLENRLHNAQQRQDDLLAEREDELQRLKQQIEQMQIDYQNLLDIKIGLDREIATYRKLLESEEER